MIKGLEVDKIASVAVVQTTRALAYLPPPRSQLLLMSEVNANAALQKSGAVPVHEFEHEENSAVGLVGSPASGSSRLQVVSTAEQFTTILITQTDGKEHVLRGAKVDRVMKWVNIIATVRWSLLIDTQRVSIMHSMESAYSSIAFTLFLVFLH